MGRAGAWTGGAAAAALVGLVALGASATPGADQPGPATEATPRSQAGTVREAPPAEQAPAVAPSAEPAATAPAAPDLLQQAGGGDGDSWRDTAGTEYRLGMVNAPEVGDCYAAEATERRKALLRDGFRAQVYSTDRYGRRVARVTTADGQDLAVSLARSGHVDDRYLEQFAHENPDLAEALRPAFAAAKAQSAGLWGACRAGPAPTASAPPPAAAPQPVAPQPAAARQPAGTACHPDYATCVPVKGDGSGNGDANDLDCGDIGRVVQLRRPGTDPYRLDREGDGVGCESYG